MSKLHKDLDDLKSQVEKAYSHGVSIEDAERFAAKCLSAQITIAEELITADLDARMKKNGVKAIKAAIWHEAATKDEKKPSDKMLDSIVDMNKLVQDEQAGFDRADAEKDNLNVLLGIFRDAHIYFRSISKNAYNG
jgi:hypothetical protein